MVPAAYSAAEARARLREPVDVVLMDYALPDGTGAEVTRAVKARRPKAPVIMLTAHDDDETVLDSIQAGADGFLSKTASTDEVVAAIQVGPRRRDAAPARGHRQDRAARPDGEGARGRRSEDRAADRARARDPPPAERRAHDPRDLHRAVDRPEHAPDPRPEHHRQAEGPLEARGGRVRACATGWSSPRRPTTASTPELSRPSRPHRGFRPTTRSIHPPGAGGRAGRWPVARRPAAGGPGSSAGFIRRRRSRRSTSRRSGLR